MCITATRSVHSLDAAAQMGYQAGGHLRIHARSLGGHKVGHFLSTMGIPGFELARIRCLWGQAELVFLFEFSQMLDSHLEYVGLLQFGYGFAFGLQGADHKVFQFVETSINPCSSLAFQKWFHDLTVLVRS